MKSLAASTTPTYSNISLKFVIHTYASGYKVGAVISQMQRKLTNHGAKERSVRRDPCEEEEEDVLSPIVLTSKQLNVTQQKWRATKNEAYAIINAVITFYYYLYGTSFTVVTDHSPLERLFTKKNPTGRIARWTMDLQALDI